MKRLLGGWVLGIALWMPWGLTVHAQTAPRMVTLTFALTVNGAPSPADSFVVAWGETGTTLCSAPCQGGGHTYMTRETFPEGVTETFTFRRATPPVTPEHPAQVFSTQTVTTDRDRTLTAFFTYGTASVAAPATGTPAATLRGALLAGSGVILLTAASWRRRSHVGRAGERTAPVRG